MNLKRAIVRCVVLLWFLIVFVIYYVTFFDKVVLGGAMHSGFLGALVDFFGK